MLFARLLFLVTGFGFFAAAIALVAYDIYLSFELDRILHRGRSVSAGEISPAVPALPRPRRQIRLGTCARLTLIGAIAALAGSSIVVVPDGRAGVRISQISGVLPGTLYSGTHFVVPLIDRVELYDVRDRIFATDAAEIPHEKLDVLTVEAREGLTIGIAAIVRYRIDPRRLDYIQANLPQPVDSQIVAPVVLSAFRELAPNYVVRDVFSVKREEFRQRAAQLITARLAGDAITVKEVLIRKIELPEEYAKGLEGLLLKEQADDQTSVDADIELKRVKIADSQAEAMKVRQVKRAEADAQSRVIMAKAESDAMQYTLPLKQKQIEQSRLEAVARKQTTIENADAEAQAKVIDSKAEQQRQNLLADAEANRIRVTSQAESEQLLLQAAALHSNPLLVQYTVAQKLSDKVQIMLVPSDGKFFFTNDVLRSAIADANSDPDASAAANPLTGASVRVPASTPQTAKR
jgi:regulator of protease activity HflC (stomatin/prohibitin superfamily)